MRLSLAECIFILALGAAFAPAVVAMADVWSSVDYYSHGYLVPLVALWAATGQRHRLPQLPVSRDVRGIALLGLAFALHLSGLAVGLPILQGIGLVCAVAGGVLYLRGAAWLRTLAFPIGYLLFMAPIPSAWLTPLIVQLQLFVSSVGVELIQLAGHPVLRDGNVIQLPGGEALFVAEACSGITSIVTLLPLAVFLAYFTERTLGRRLVIVVAVLPLALVGNLIRVLATVFAAQAYGVSAATGGLLHDSTGLVTYVLGCLALLGVGAIMGYFFPVKIPAGAQ